MILIIYFFVWDSANTFHVFIFTRIAFSALCHIRTFFLSLSLCAYKCSTFELTRRKFQWNSRWISDAFYLSCTIIGFVFLLRSLRGLRFIHEKISSTLFTLVIHPCERHKRTRTRSKERRTSSLMSATFKSQLIETMCFIELECGAAVAGLTHILFRFFLLSYREVDVRALSHQRRHELLACCGSLHLRSLN